MITLRRTICLALLPIGVIALIWVWGGAFWLVLGLVSTCLVGAVLPEAGGRAASGTGRFAAIALVIGSVFVGLALVEATLWILERAASAPLPAFVAAPGAVPLAPELPPEIEARIERMQGALVMPPGWQRHRADIPGAEPFVWHGVIHEVDANGMRRQQPFPPKDPERLRIMVVGDSLTYGEGIDGFWTYPAQLERLLAADARVEVVNLGVRAYASRDILNVVRRFVPDLKPDLVVYGVCLNDFLESGGRQPAPVSLLPEKVSRILTRRTRVGRLVAERFGALARASGLEPNFYADLLTGFEPRYRRFGDDVAAMNAFVTASGLPPMIAMVLDQAPRLDGPGRQLAVAAEHQLQQAGIQIVASEDFYRLYDGRNFRVSRWEGHPNEEANAIWASQLAGLIRQQPALAHFRQAATVEPKP